jgi:hypothetical protein
MATEAQGSGPTGVDTEDPSTTTTRLKDEAARVGQTIQEEASRVVEEGKDQGRVLLEDARDRVTDEARRQTGRASESLRSVSSDLRSMAQATDGSESPAASWVRMGADGIGTLADRLDRKGFDGIVQDVGRFARNNPTTFLFTAFSVGFVAGRLVKNIDRDRMRAQSEAPAPMSGNGRRTMAEPGA